MLSARFSPWFACGKPSMKTVRSCRSSAAKHVHSSGYGWTDLARERCGKSRHVANCTVTAHKKGRDGNRKSRDGAVALAVTANGPPIELRLLRGAVGAASGSNVCTCMLLRCLC